MWGRTLVVLKPHEVDTVLYHSPCLDGFTAAWVAMHYQDQNPGLIKAPVELIPVVHGNEPPDVTGRRVLIVDFSYPRETMLRMREVARELLVLDHHESALKALGGLDFVVFDLEQSGAGLAWRYFFPGEAPCKLVQYVEDRDLRRFQFSDSLSFNAYLGTLALTLSDWDVAHEAAECGGWKIVGEAARNYQKQLIEMLAKNGRPMPVKVVGKNCHAHHWQEVVVACAPPQFVDEVGHRLLGLFPECRIAFVWSHDGDCYRVSLRSRGDVDVSALATAVGGGGHKGASAFAASWLVVGRDTGVTAIW